jgi:hypothetical protein
MSILITFLQILGLIVVALIVLGFSMPRLLQWRSARRSGSTAQHGENAPAQNANGRATGGQKRF